MIEFVGLHLGFLQIQQSLLPGVVGSSSLESFPGETLAAESLVDGPRSFSGLPSLSRSAALFPE